MYYLRLTPTTFPAHAPHPSASLQGPFASEQEARGFFRKLTMWYPEAMRETHYTITILAEYETDELRAERGAKSSKPA